MPLVCDEQTLSKPEDLPYEATGSRSYSPPKQPARRQSQHSCMAKVAIMSNHHNAPASEAIHVPDDREPPPNMAPAARPAEHNLTARSQQKQSNQTRTSAGVGAALTDTPLTTAPNSPRIPPIRKDSGSSTTSRSRPTTLDIPGLTKSRVSPDGRIAQRDVGSKLVIVMVGLPARGKSYITKKITRYLNWLQHDTRIFNVGERRRVAAGLPSPPLPSSSKLPTGRDFLRKLETTASSLNGFLNQKDLLGPPALPSKITVNGEGLNPESHRENGSSSNETLSNGTSNHEHVWSSKESTFGEQSDYFDANETSSTRAMDQSAEFFDPNNVTASQIREQVAMETLDELLDYILDQGGSVGIFDATNSTIERRKRIVERVRGRAGPELGVLFLESLCIDENLLESNMRLKLSGPDYKDKDPITALADFKRRVSMYEKNYVRLGDYEEHNNIPYIQMIDVGRKVVSHQIRGFLSAQTVYYLLNFNLSPRQIWITRHGESLDNVNGKIGGDSDLSENGKRYARTLTKFIKQERQAWDVRQRDKALSTHFPPHPGDTTPPNPEYSSHGSQPDETPSKSFCVWSSMLKRSIQTAQYFDEEEFDIKQMKMLDELNAGTMEGMTYEEIRTHYSAEYELRKKDKLHYRYPGAGGEGYLDIINRLRAVIVEVERMTDHVLLVGHRSVARVLLAYFKGLKRDDVADLDVPLGWLYCLEPKPYGVDFKAYQYNSETDDFHVVDNYELRRSAVHTV